jgi:LysM repeat protein
MWTSGFDTLGQVSVPRPRIRRAAVVIAVGCSILGVVPTIVESAASPASVEVAGIGSYTVRRGDYLYAITRATGTELSTLLSLNGLSLNSVIHPGQVLRTNGSTGAPDPATAPAWSGGTYTVRRGDYLYAIARATGTELSTLLSLNGLSLNSVIHPGRVLRTNGSTGAPDPATAPEWSGATYTVRRGDYLYAIARATGTKLSTLLTLNGLSLNTVIHPGQVLKTSGAGPAASGGTYTVVSGDCWSCIARRFGVPTRDVLAANGATASTMIHPGQVIDLPAGAKPDRGSPPGSTPTLAQRPSSSDPWLSAQLRAAVGAWRVDLAASLDGRPVRIVWDSSVPGGTEAVTASTMTIRVHPRLKERSTRVLHNVLAHEFGHIMVVIALENVALSDPGVCHEKVADEIASRIRERTVRLHTTVECTWDEAQAIADKVFAQGF